MLYKFIYYQFYKWTKKQYGDEYPQFYAINIICLLITINILVGLKILSSFEILEISMSFIKENTLVAIIYILIPLYLFNSIYFFYINKWWKIIEDFEKKKVDFRINLFYKVYILGTIISFIAFVFI